MELSPLSHTMSTESPQRKQTGGAQGRGFCSFFCTIGAQPGSQPTFSSIMPHFPAARMHLNSHGCRLQQTSPRCFSPILSQAPSNHLKAFSSSDPDYEQRQHQSSHPTTGAIPCLTTLSCGTANFIFDGRNRN